MSEAPKRPPRPTRPRSTITSDTVRDDPLVCSPDPSSAAGSQPKNSDDQLEPREGHSEMVETGITASSDHNDDLGSTTIGAGKDGKDVNLPEGKTEMEKYESTGKTTPVKSNASTLTAEQNNCLLADVSVTQDCKPPKRSPKTKKAPPIPPPPVLPETHEPQSVASRPEDHSESLETFPGDTEEKCKKIAEKDGDEVPQTSTAGDVTKSVPAATSRPTIKPKPVYGTSAETSSPQPTSSRCIPSIEETKHACKSEQEVAPTTFKETTSDGIISSEPVYAVVNKPNRRSGVVANSELDCKAEAGKEEPEKEGTPPPLVMRTKGAAASPGGSAPKKPPRTFAHSDYMRLKTSGLTPSPRPAAVHQIAGDYAEIDTAAKENLHADEKPAETIAEEKPETVSTEKNLPPAETNTDSTPDGKVKRRQTNDKLPAPPRPPPPSLTDGKTASPPCRKSMADDLADRSTASLSRDTVELRRSARGSKTTVDRKRAERSTSMLERGEAEKRKVLFGRFRSVLTSSKPSEESVDGIYAVPSEVVAGAERKSATDATDAVKTSDDRGLSTGDGKKFFSRQLSSSPARSTATAAETSEASPAVSTAEAETSKQGLVAVTSVQKRQQVARAKISNAYSILRLNQVNLSSESDVVISSEIGEDVEGEASADEHQRHLEHVAAIRDKTRERVMKYVKAKSKDPPPDRLFDYAVAVELRLNDDCNACLPHVTFQYPEQPEESLKFITQFCFPDAQIWRPVTIYDGEIFSFVLTDGNGDRRFGYCRRYLPSGKGNRLPESLCIVSTVCEAPMYEQLLRAAEERSRTLQPGAAHDLLRTAYDSACPLPNHEIVVRTAGLDGRKSLTLRRSGENKPENVSFDGLISRLPESVLVQVFGSLLLERRIVFCAQQLGTLTSCIHSMLALLYPFEWQHVFIPVLPATMTDILEAPMPFVVGILASTYARLLQRHDFSFTEMLVVDLDGGTLLHRHGDEERIIPHKLQKALITSIRDDSDSVGLRDISVTEAFLRFFIETCGHYTEYVCTQQDGLGVFERELFVKAVSSRSIRLFLEWFSATQMFDVYITEELCGQTHPMFEQRIQEYRDEMAEMSTSIKQNVKLVGRKIKDFIVESGGKIKKKFQRNVYV